MSQAFWTAARGPRTWIQQVIDPLLNKLGQDLAKKSGPGGRFVPAPMKRILTESSKKLLLQQINAIDEAKEKAQKHPEFCVVEWVALEMKTMTRKGTRYEAYIDEIINAFLNQIFPAEGRFCIAPQARHLEELPSNIVDTSIIAQDNTVHDISGVSETSIRIDLLSRQEPDVSFPASTSALPHAQSPQYGSGSASPAASSESEDILSAPLDDVPPTSLAPYGLLPATTDLRIHQERIIPSAIDRMNRTVPALASDSRHMIPEFHVYHIQGPGRDRFPILVVEDKRELDPRKQLTKYLQQIFSANKKALGLGVRCALNGPGLEFLLLEYNEDQPNRVSAVPFTSREIWHRYDSQILFRRLLDLAGEYWKGD